MPNSSVKPAEQCEVIAGVVDAAINRAKDECSTEDLYVHSMTADGQYWTVTVGVGNEFDLTYEIDETKVMAMRLDYLREGEGY